MAENKKPITEAQVVQHIIENWDTLMDPSLKLYGKELYWSPNWRCDLTAYYQMELSEEYGYKDKPYKYRAPMFIEVKYDSDSRDLMYEIKKGLKVVNDGNWPRHIAVFSDDFSDQAIYNFLVENNVHMWKIEVTNNDLSTLKLKYMNNCNDKFHIEASK